jgi:hypothetical protein
VGKFWAGSAVAELLRQFAVLPDVPRIRQDVIRTVDRPRRLAHSEKLRRSRTIPVHWQPASNQGCLRRLTSRRECVDELLLGQLNRTDN